MCLDSLNWALWVRFHGRYWYQSFIDGSNIWGVDRTDPWGPEMDHPPLGRSYLVVVPSYDMSCALILLTGLYGWDSMVDIGYQSFIDGSNIWGVDRNDPWGPEMDHPPLVRSYLVVVPSYDMSCVLILLTGLYWWDSMVDIDINPSSMGPIFGVWIGPTLGVPKWTIRHWAVSYWVVVPVVWYVMCLDSLNWALWVRFHGPILISILHRWVQYLGCGSDRPLGSRNGPSAIGPQLFGSSAVVWYVMCLDSLNWVSMGEIPWSILISILHRWVQYLGCG